MCEAKRVLGSCAIWNRSILPMQSIGKMPVNTIKHCHDRKMACPPFAVGVALWSQAGGGEGRNDGEAAVPGIEDKRSGTMPAAVDAAGQTPVSGRPPGTFPPDSGARKPARSHKEARHRRRESQCRQD